MSLKSLDKCLYFSCHTRDNPMMYGFIGICRWKYSGLLYLQVWQLICVFVHGLISHGETRTDDTSKMICTCSDKIIGDTSPCIDNQGICFGKQVCCSCQSHNSINPQIRKRLICRCKWELKLMMHLQTLGVGVEVI